MEVTKLPSPFDHHPDPLRAVVHPEEGMDHGAFGQVAMWITKAMAELPSGGALGRMELLKIWDALPVEERKKLVQARRVLLSREMGE